MKLPNGERVKIIGTLAEDWRIVRSQLNFDRAGNQLDIIEKQKLKVLLYVARPCFSSG